MPQPSTDGAFDVTFYNSTDYPNASDDPLKEIVRVTARTSDALTITRAQQGTAASAKNTASKVYLMVLTPTKRTDDYTNGKTTSYAPSGAGTTTIDVSLSKVSVMTMPAATQTIALSNVEVGQLFIIEVIHAASEGALTMFSTIKWVDGVSPVAIRASGSKDTFGFRCTSAGNYDGYYFGNTL